MGKPLKLVIFLAFVSVVIMTSLVHANVTDANLQTPSPYALLRRDLLSREAITDKVPPGGGRQRVTMQVMMIPFDILDVDDALQVVTSSAFVAISWADPALAWNKTAGSYAGLHFVELHLQDIWKPRILFVNGASDTRMLNVLWGDEITILAEGIVTIMASPVLSFTCDLELRLYPFDTQTCRMMLYIHSQVGIVAEAVIHSNIFGLQISENEFGVRAEWTLLNVTAESKLASTIGDVYLEYTWTLKRKTTFFVVSFIAPIVMTSYMNVLVFVIPAECGEKISYLVSIFVSTAVFVSFCTTEMPQGLDSVPLVMYLVLGIMAESGILIVIISIIRRLSRGNHSQTSDIYPDTTSITFIRTLKRPLSANSVSPLDENAKADNCTEQGEKKLPVPGWLNNRRNVITLDTILFVVALVLNSVFVVSLLLCMV